MQASEAATPRASPLHTQRTPQPQADITKEPRHDDAGRHEPVEILPIERAPARFLKRFLDLVVAVPMAIVSLPLLALLWLVVRATSRGPFLFSQYRVGRRGVPIRVVKIRSMSMDADQHLRDDGDLYDLYVASGYKVPAEQDPRVTAVGRFLRKTSLDELPQIYCVLRGQMSMVGPRPVLPDELVSLYGTQAGVYLACKPGITGAWQVSGRSHIRHDHRVALDVNYACRWTFREDLTLVARTVPAVLTCRGAH